MVEFKGNSLPVAPNWIFLAMNVDQGGAYKRGSQKCFQKYKFFILRNFFNNFQILFITLQFFAKFGYKYWEIEIYTFQG